MTINPISVEATPRKVLSLVMKHDLSGCKILDLGAGEGYLTQALYNEMTKANLNPSDNALYACDKQPECYKFDAVKCDAGDFDARLPYPDKSFDIVCFVEVIEHLENQFACLREIHRILKPGGTLYITTPNILNMNSRIRFFTAGLFFQFNLLSHTMDRNIASSLTGHINPVGYPHLSYMLKRTGFTDIVPHVDRHKTSAVLWTLLFYVPIKIYAHFILGYQKKRGVVSENRDVIRSINSFTLLTSRSLVLSCRDGKYQNEGEQSYT